MIEIGKTIVGFDVIRRKFCCNLAACRGVCCVYGDAGAPLSTDESGDLGEHLDEIRPFLSEGGLRAVNELGAFVRDTDGEIVTPLVDGKECAYAIFENGIALCAIERAHRDHAIPFNKPLSCHLYPIRIKAFEEFDAVNYDVWDICNPARKEGEEKGIPVYRFVREALIRKYGEEWYEQLDYAARNLDPDKYPDQ
jgi:hypothetical protein